MKRKTVKNIHMEIAHSIKIQALAKTMNMCIIVGTLNQIFIRASYTEV